MTIIIKNTTESEIFISDLAGQAIEASGQIILTDFYSFIEISNSSALKTLINNDTIIVNDGTKDLNKVQGIKKVTGVSEFDLSSIDFGGLDSTSSIDIQFVFGSDVKSYYEVSSTSWVMIRTFLFRGSAINGVPTSCKIVGYVEDGDSPCYIQLYDYTNDKIIAELTFSEENITIATLSNISNIPPGESIFQIRARCSDRSDSLYLYSFIILF